MVNEYVKDDNRATNDAHHQETDDEYCMDNDPMELEDWETFYSDDLYNLWGRMEGYLQETGAAAYMLLHVPWPDFVKFCYNNSLKNKYWTAVGH